MAVTLREITPENEAQVRALRTTTAQERFVSTVDDSLQEAADHPEGYDRYSPMVSRLMHLLIIDVLATCVALRIGSSLQPILQQMKENLRAKRYA